MNITKKMIDDMFNIITATLDAVAKVDPKATSITTTQLAVDVLAKTMDSLKADIETYFITAEPGTADATTAMKDEYLAQAQAIAAKAANAADDTFEKIWTVAKPLLDLIVDTAKVNLPKGSTAVNAIITAIDAITAMGDQLAIDLPKLNKN